MKSKLASVAALLTVLLLGLASRPRAQTIVGEDMTIRVRVRLVQMNVAVTDAQGNYVNGLGPEEFQIYEDNISQQTAIFEEGNQVQRILIRGGKEPILEPPKVSRVAVEIGPLNLARLPAPPPEEEEVHLGANVFILFDTSDYMYKDFASAQDSMADFARSLDPLNKVAFYSYSRNLSRKVMLTSDRAQVLRAVHNVSAGDEDALFNSMRLALREASTVQGKKQLVVFSHGPDTASTVTPESVSELAQSAGIPVYMVSTGKAQLDPLTRRVFERLSRSTGGQAYFAATRDEEQQAFSAIREDLAHLYTLSYYPKPNPNNGWRSIGIKLVGPNADKGYTLRTREGYRAESTASQAQSSAVLAPE